MNKLGKASFAPDTNGWKFVDEKSDDQTLTNEMATYFSNISKNFTPVDGTLLPVYPAGGDFVSDVVCYPHEHEVYEVLKTSKKTCSLPRDIPLKVLNNFLPDLVRPITNIFCQCISEGVYPTSWKTEYVNIIPKVFPPNDYGDLRNLSLTEFLSKSFEHFLLDGTPTVNGLTFYIKRYIDRNQFAVSGSSYSHALIEIIDF